MNAFDSFIIYSIWKIKCPNIATNFSQQNNFVCNMKCEMMRNSEKFGTPKIPSNSEINNINKILVMNGVAYIIEMARHRHEFMMGFI